MATKSLVIKVNEAAYDFSNRRWQEITGMSLKQVARNLLTRNGHITPQEYLEITQKIDILLSKIPMFIPRTYQSIEMNKKYNAENARWYRHLRSLKLKYQRSGKVVMLADAVNEILKSNKSKQRCTNDILAKHLCLTPNADLSPEKVAMMMTENAGTPWNLIKDIPQKKYTFRINETKKKTGGVKQAGKKKNTLENKAIKSLLFPYEIKTTIEDDKFLLSRLNNDIAILDQYNRWCEGDYGKNIATSNDHYRKYDELRQKLQTFEKVKSADYLKVAAKFERREKLSEYDQIIFVKNQRCPKCGCQLSQRYSSMYGNFIVCTGCDYKADGNFEKARIKNQFKLGVTPTPFK